MLNIVIPMAGEGSRFKKAGYETPKPFIDVFGKPMIQYVVENLTPYEPHRFIFIVRREHEKLIKEHLSFATDSVVYVDEPTEGAACTVLLAQHLIDNEEPLVLANSDQFIVWNDKSQIRRGDDGSFWRETNNLQDMLNTYRHRDAEGGIAYFNALHPKWSYVAFNHNGLVTKVAEKQAISENATCGIYYFREGGKFVWAAKQMISKDIRTNGEFYVCPVYNELIKEWAPVVGYKVHTMLGMGTPEDLKETKRIL